MSTSSAPTPQPQPLATATISRRFTIGLPRCSSPSERRFPITPEAARRLVDDGFRLKMEEGAAEVIHYADAAYERAGVELTSRDEALGCDIVVHLAPLSPTEVRKMRRGAMLLCLSHLDLTSPASARELLSRGIITIAIDLITAPGGRHPFADILAEIDGRASIALASSLLADGVRGKGILLGGVAGVVPCEVTILGSDNAARAAAESAVGLGALVRLFDDDVYSLREALRLLSPGVVGSVLHTRVLRNALRTADIVLATSLSRPVTLTPDDIAETKRGVLTFDLSSRHGDTFPSLPTVDLAAAAPTDNTLSGNRVCYINAGSAVPRTAAMALSNAFLNFFADIISLNGLTNALKLTPDLQAGALTFLGRATNRAFARIVDVPHVNISLILQLS